MFLHGPAYGRQPKSRPTFSHRRSFRRQRRREALGRFRAKSTEEARTRMGCPLPTPLTRTRYPARPDAGFCTLGPVGARRPKTSRSRIASPSAPCGRGLADQLRDSSGAIRRVDHPRSAVRRLALLDELDGPLSRRTPGDEILALHCAAKPILAVFVCLTCGAHGPTPAQLRRRGAHPAPRIVAARSPRGLGKSAGSASRTEATIAQPSLAQPSASFALVLSRLQDGQSSAAPRTASAGHSARDSRSRQ